MGSAVRPMALGGARFAGGWNRSFAFRRHHFRRFAPFAVGFGLGWPYAYSDYGYYGYGDCYQLMQVPTPYGWRLRRVYVCG